MDAVSVRLFVQENRQLHGRSLYEWLLEWARNQGVPGGSAVRAMSGFGRHGRLHEDHFFELGGDLPVVVEFILAADEAERLLAQIDALHLGLFYVQTPVRMGLTHA